MRSLDYGHIGSSTSSPIEEQPASLWAIITQEVSKRSGSQEQGMGWGQCIIFLGPQSTSCPFRTASHARSVATTRPWAPSVFLMADFLLLLPVGEDTWAVSCLFPSYPNLVSAWSVL